MIPHVANYYGRLSFDLVGRYRESGEARDVFGFNFVSPTEYHYLFAAANEEVLDDSCPMEWVGSRIVTPLGSKQAIRIVPDRLTYLAAARTLPSQLIGTNWSRNEEWRDSFVTGLDVTAYEYPPDRLIVTASTSTCRRCTRPSRRHCTTTCSGPARAAASAAKDSLFDRTGRSERQ